MPSLFPESALPVPAAPPESSRRARPARLAPQHGARFDDDVPRPLESMRPEWRDAIYWCEQMLAAADDARKQECQANMVRCVLALDRTQRPKARPLQ